MRLRSNTLDETVVGFNLSITETVNSTQSNQPTESTSKIADNNNQFNMTTPSQADMFKLLVDIKKSVDGLNKFETNVSNKITHHDKEIKSINIQLSSNSNDIVSIKRRLERMDSNHTAQVDLVHSLELHKQTQLRNNISIMGISPETDENLIDIVLSVCETIGVSCNKNHIEFVKRISQSKAHIIIVKFTTSQMKDAMMRSSARKGIKLSDLFKDTEDGRIYINGQVTPHFSKILAYGRSLVKSGALSSCYMTPVGVAIKFNAEANHIPIKSIDEIDQRIDEVKSKRSKPDKRHQSEIDSSPSDIVQTSKSLRKKK